MNQELKTEVEQINVKIEGKLSENNFDNEDCDCALKEGIPKYFLMSIVMIS